MAVEAGKVDLIVSVIEITGSSKIVIIFWNSWIDFSLDV